MSRPVTDDTATAPAAPAAPTTDDIRDAVARTVGVAAEAIADDTNLVAVGLKSLHMMQLINGWRRAGHRVSLKDLAADPTVRAWSRLLS
ncbi:phosphopantetheine-binding protein [Streptomyces sp. NBC_00199]|uniref:phosphopantetheine-binding protein n=1 Tax=Streptomyces sp. NBC_00199 TaxID=2975678 RepID=UPI00224CE749|nr:phosphopantetheine-binding protein [Streptomyces sp. NBC_00199]MCX5262420.1 phosphopantetheine-binding protein [Streptomyces sp. NBC_00199]MCX5269788.1 phosphopantetheine-binding protein [Streptomyces sp. NBC_00199]